MAAYEAFFTNENLEQDSGTFALFNAGKQYEILGYQRSYAWGKVQANGLLTSLISGEGKVRLNCMTFQYSPDRNAYMIVDGQQRLTTISLILAAIYHVLDEEGVDTNGFILPTINNPTEGLLGSYATQRIAGRRTFRPRIKFTNEETDATFRQILTGSLDTNLADWDSIKGG